MSRQLILSIIAITLGRLVINITKRFPYPFVSAIAGQFAVAPSAIQNVIALNNATGLLSPAFGTVSEKYGRKPVMLVMLGIMSVASFLGVLIPEYSVFVLAMIAFGFGKIIYDPTFQAYCGDVIPLNRRATIMGITELGWAGSLIIASPVVGFILDTGTMRSVFIFLTLCLVVGFIAVWQFAESDVRSSTEKNAIKIISPIAALNIIRQHRPAVFGLIFAFCLTSSNELFFINYGLWMERSFDLALTALGTVTIVVAIAEVIGEFIVIGIADRIGTKRTALGGALLATIFYLIIPSLSNSLPMALAGILFMFVGVETAIVASIPMFTEILPNARAVMMSGNMGAHSLGRVIGAAFGGFIYATTGEFAIVGMIASIVGGICFIVMWRFIPTN